MTLTNILAEAYRRLSFDTSPGTAVTTRLTGFANSSYKEIMSDPILENLRRRTLPVATIASSPYTTLPAAVIEVYTIVDRTNQFPLEVRDQQWIRDQDPGRTNSSANPYAYAVVDRQSPVAAQPSDSSQLLVKSSSAADTTQTVQIEVITAKGYVRQASAVLTGTVAVNLGPADSIDVEDLYLSAVSAGEITLTEDTSGGTELARIGIGQLRSRYYLLELFPIPSAVLTLYADCKVRVTDMANATDEPLLEDEHCEAIILGIEEREYRKREKETIADRRRTSFEKIWRPRLHLYAHKKRGSASDGMPTRWSQLGPYYPPGS